jgi:hypothetical protein
MDSKPSTRQVSEAAIGDGEFSYRFGEVAFIMNLLTRSQVEDALGAQKRLKEQDQPVQIGQFMVEKGTLTPSQVTAILIAQKRYRKDSPPLAAAHAPPSPANAPTQPIAGSAAPSARSGSIAVSPAVPVQTGQGATTGMASVPPDRQLLAGGEGVQRGSTVVSVDPPRHSSIAKIESVRKEAPIVPADVPPATDGKKDTKVEPQAVVKPAVEDEPEEPEPAPESHQPPPGVGAGVYKKFGQFDLIRRIGEGSMGALFETWNTQHQLRMALKVLPKKLAVDKEFFTRFKREINTLSNLNHPNIVRFFGAGEMQGYTYYCMEFIDGESLQMRIDREGRLPQKESLRICGDIARALAHAHSKGVIHRDIKPENVLLSRKGEVKVTDFGLAKTRDEESQLTVAGTSIGTPYYLSPEQAMGLTTIDHRADLYSLGVTMYHLLTGRLPFDAKSSTEVMMMHVKAQPPDPRTINPGLARGLSQVILRLMEKNPANRFSSADSIVEVVDLLLNAKPPNENESVVQPGTTKKKTSFKTFLFHLFFSKAGLALALVIGLLLAAWYFLGSHPAR